MCIVLICMYMVKYNVVIYIMSIVTNNVLTSFNTHVENIHTVLQCTYKYMCITCIIYIYIYIPTLYILDTYIHVHVHTYIHILSTCTHIRYAMRTEYYILIVRDKGHSSVVNVESSPQQQEWENTK